MIRVIIDLSRIEYQSNKYIWFAVDTTTIDTIHEFKTFLCNQLDLKHKRVTLHVKDALLRDEDTILLLREDDVVRVLYKAKRKKASKRKMDSSLNAEELHLTLPQDKCSKELSSNHNSHSSNDRIKRKAVKDEISNEGDSEENQVHQIKTKKKKNKEIKKQKNIEETPLSINTLAAKPSKRHKFSSSVSSTEIDHINECPTSKKSVHEVVQLNIVPNEINATEGNISMDKTMESVGSDSVDIGNRSINSKEMDPIDESPTLKKSVCENVQLSIVSNGIYATEGNIFEDKTIESLTVDSVNTGSKRKRKRVRRRRRKCANPVLNDQLTVVNEMDKNKLVHNDDPVTASTAVIITSTPQPISENVSRHIKFVDISDDSSAEKDVVCLETNGNSEARMNNNTNNIKHKETSNLDSVTCDQKPEKSVPFGNANHDNVPVTCENVVVACSVDSKDCTIPDTGKKDACEKKESKVKIDEEYKRLNTLPSVGDHIAYKVLELNETYCPEISEYKEGVVKSIEPNDDMLEIELFNEEIKQPREGKFELVWSDNVTSAEKVKIVFVKWGDVIDPRLIEKKSN